MQRKQIIPYLKNRFSDRSSHIAGSAILSALHYQFTDAEIDDFVCVLIILISLVIILTKDKEAPGESKPNSDSLSCKEIPDNSSKSFNMADIYNITPKK